MTNAMVSQVALAGYAFVLIGQALPSVMAGHDDFEVIKKWP
jgi:hypothetical protein